MECESMLFITNRFPYLWSILNFSNSVLDLHSEVVSFSDIRKNEAQSFDSILNGDWYKTLNLVHASCYKMLHIVFNKMN